MGLTCMWAARLSSSRGPLHGAISPSLEAISPRLEAISPRLDAISPCLEVISPLLQGFCFDAKSPRPALGHML
ncbi:hypothetical protein ACLB2K_036885 [Fragaria x ananassa]